MNRRSLFRSLGLAAIVAGVAALPKMTKDVVPEGAPPYTKEPSKSLPETPWMDPINPNVEITTPWVYGYPLAVDPTLHTTSFPYMQKVDGSWGWTTTGANHLTFTSASTLTITGAANPTIGFVQAVG